MFKKNILRYVIVTVFMVSLFVAKAPADVVSVESDDWFASESTWKGFVKNGTLYEFQQCPGVWGLC